MIALLVVTTDLKITEQLNTLMRRQAVRMRNVSSLSCARKWLQLQDYDVLILDLNVPSVEIEQLYNEAMRKNRNTVIIAVDNLADISRRLQQLGAQITERNNLAVELLARLPSIAQPLPLGESPRRILLVDDLDSPRDVISFYIQSLQYDSITAVSNAKEALEILKEDPDSFFCVVTDLQMPNISGLQLLRNIRNDPALKHIPVIALTANATSHVLVDCLREGISGFLVKPPQRKQFKSELERAKRIRNLGLSPRLCPTDKVSDIADAVMSAYSNP